MIGNRCKQNARKWKHSPQGRIARRHARRKHMVQYLVQLAEIAGHPVDPSWWRIGSITELRKLVAEHAHRHVQEHPETPVACMPLKRTKKFRGGRRALRARLRTADLSYLNVANWQSCKSAEELYQMISEGFTKHYVQEYIVKPLVEELRAGT